MSSARTVFALAAIVLGAGLYVVNSARPALGSPFTAFAEDEDACRKAGAAAIGGASAYTAERRYDAAYGQCMAIHGRMRRMGTPQQGIPPGSGYAERNPHSFDFPDAYYSIPYATPGYGYDGFGY